MRTHRVRVAAAAAVTAAALSLTACQGSAGGTRDEGRASSPTTTAPTTTAPTTAPEPTSTSTPAPTSTTADPAPSGNASTSPQGSSGTTPAPGKSKGNGKGGSGGGGKDTAVDRPCDASAVRVVYSPVSRPLNHALLTVTNTGRTACNAYYAPVLRLDDGQAAVAVEQSSKPQAVVTLFPGESAYAAMILSAADGSGKHGRTSKSLTVWFAPRDNSGSAGGPAVLKLPAGTYTDSTTRVTYWQSSMENALSF
ncbi:MULTISPECIES: DUF4232 domain-containing protein [unclassified Streptomyces]|uniref:DUF4232 domain-containing protein n=1 Tax=unclassified Streptomyces TaxID=2593676 RepID=UPI003327EC14